MKETCPWPAPSNCYLLAYIVHESKLVLGWINIHKAPYSRLENAQFPYHNLKVLEYKYHSDCSSAHWKLILNSHKCALNANMWRNFQLAWHFLPSFLAVNAYYFAAHSRALIITLPKTKRQFLINSHILSYGKKFKEVTTYANPHNLLPGSNLKTWVTLIWITELPKIHMKSEEDGSEFWILILAGLIFINRLKKLYSWNIAY